MTKEGTEAVRIGAAPDDGSASSNDSLAARTLGRTVGRTARSVLSAAGAMTLLEWLAPASLLVMLAGAIIAIINPPRGIQDRVAGTWIVPR